MTNLIWLSMVEKLSGKLRSQWPIQQCIYSREVRLNDGDLLLAGGGSVIIDDPITVVQRL